MHSIKLIALDIDGTLLNSRHELTPRTEATLKQAAARGIQIVLATGKTRNSSRNITMRLGIKTPGVYVQGLVVVDENDQVLYQQTLDHDILKDMFDFVEGTDYSLTAYNGHTIIAGHHSPQTARLVHYHEPYPEIVTPLHQLIATRPINKVQFFDDAERIQTIRKNIEPRLRGRATLTMPAWEILEILPLGASKGVGLQWLLGHLAIDPQNVLAVGDGENDIEMIQLAGIGVAMGNAMPKLKAAAKYVTATNDEDGVAAAIEKYALNGA
jgi:Cof subfamily protein (haloacid dehalogenase superfamily)